MTGFDSKRKMARDKLVVTDIDGHVVRDARKPKKAQPAQEPVATLNIGRFRNHLVNHDFDYFGDLPDGTHSLYTAPTKRTWVGLTDEEREEIALEVPIDAVCITEAKLKEKNFD